MKSTQSHRDSEFAMQEGFARLLLRLRGLGINDPGLLKSVEQIPRQDFVPPQYRDFSYIEQSLPIECGQVMTGVDHIIRWVDAMKVTKNQSVLEIGTGTGYQTALLALLSKRVVSLERFRTLSNQAALRLERLQIQNAILEVGDGCSGLSKDGRAVPMLFERIFVNGALPEQPKAFLDSLGSGGMLICAIGEPFCEQEVTIFEKVGSRFERYPLYKGRFHPLIAGVAKAI
jgi:protein-L-isoaspartate(D-aspartate) O-methyltransferase